MISDYCLTTQLEIFQKLIFDDYALYERSRFFRGPSGQNNCDPFLSSEKRFSNWPAREEAETRGLDTGNTRLKKLSLKRDNSHTDGHGEKHVSGFVCADTGT